MAKMPKVTDTDRTPPFFFLLLTIIIWLHHYLAFPFQGFDYSTSYIAIKTIPLPIPFILPRVLSSLLSIEFKERRCECRHHSLLYKRETFYAPYNCSSTNQEELFGYCLMRPYVCTHALHAWFTGKNPCLLVFQVG